MNNINDLSEEMNQELNDALDIQVEREPEYVPQFRMIGNSKIMVSKTEGKLWQTRLRQCKAAMKDVKTHWDKALRYYNIDSVDYDNKKDEHEISAKTNKIESRNGCIENLIFANVMGMVPALYSQNPTITVTPEVMTPDNESMANTLERLINIILQKRVSPGINLQPKARKAIINTMIANRGIIKIGWTNKNELNDNAIRDIETISNKLQNAKDINEIQELEGQLIALNEMVDLSDSSCCYAQHILPTDLFIDPTAQEQDGSDAKWIMERTLLPIDWLKAKFGFKKNDEYRSVYNEEKVLKINDDTDDEPLTDIDDHKSYNDTYGYNNDDTFKKSQLIEAYWIWDKTKRRVYLYLDCDWEFPVWVYDDPYHLQEFYPYYILNFIESPSTTLTHGEISLYEDQQDEVNKINSQLSRMRTCGFDSWLFNTNAGVSKKDIEAWLNGVNKVVGINLPPNVRFEEVIFNGQVPYDKNQALFDKGDLLRQIDAASGTDATTRSGEYKTNTTNLAIQSYMAGKSIKLDDKRDLIERWLGNIGWGLAQLCLQYMTQDNIAEILGRDYATNWTNYNALEIRTMFNLQCVGGSTQRANSTVKQRQALEISQLLGQFASSTPMVVIIMLQMLSRAFDNFVVKKEDIDSIINSIQQQLQAQQQQQEMQAQQQQAQAQLANEQANTEQVNQAAQIQQMASLPESVQNTLLNGVMQQQTAPIAAEGVEF